MVSTSMTVRYSDNYLASSSHSLRCRAIEALRCARVSGLGLLPFFLSTHSARASSSKAWNWRPSAAAMAPTASSNSGRAFLNRRGLTNRARIDT